MRPLPVLGALGEWAPGQPTPDTPTILAHGYYKGVDLSDVQVTKLCPLMPFKWDCNMPNLKLASIYAGAANENLDQFIGKVRAGLLPPQPGFPPLYEPKGPVPEGPPPPPSMVRLQAQPESNLGLYIGIGVAALALGSAVVVKKKRKAS